MIDSDDRSDRVELIDFRTKVDETTRSVLDAVARATGEDMAAIGRDVLAQWAKNKIHEASLIQRMTKREGMGRETKGNGGES